MAERTSILAVVPDAETRGRLSEELGDASALTFVSGADNARAHLQGGEPDALLVADQPEIRPTLAGAAQLADATRRAPIVVIAEVPEREDLVRAVRCGEITDAVQHAWRPGEVAQAVRRARELAELRNERDAGGAATPDRLALMFEALDDGIMLTSQTSDEVWINASARRMLGIGESVPVTTEFLKHRLGFYPFDLLVAHSRRGGPAEPLREELRVGNRRLHSVVSPVRGPEGGITGVAVVLRDFTEAAGAMRRHQEVMTSVSHELRTPLTSITGALDIVLSEYAGRLGAKQQHYLQMAREASTRLNVTIDDMLDAVRNEREPVPVTFAPVALDELGRDVAERFRAPAARKGVQLYVRAEHDDIRLVGDPDRLTQVLNNLLTNAVKFTPDDGVIEVDIFGPSVASSHVGVSVYNNGEPIPEHAREKVFESFDELQESSDRMVGGTGLGLAMSRSIVEAHGGRIWVESRTEGTKFVFTLPSAPAETSEDRDTPHVDVERPEASGRILVVDDDRHSTYILKGILMAAGHDVDLASGADEALTLARNRHHAVVVVNANMQAADGLALVEIFKHDPETHRTCVLVLSDSERRDAALRTGADEHLAKPFEPQTLRALCARLVEEAGRARLHRVLAVDDDATIRALSREVLEQAGYSVREARNGEEALSEAKRFRPDLLLLDVMMAEMDGFQTAERFRAESATAMTPIIFLSAKGETADKVRAFRIGAEDYVVKPFDAAELVARVRKALERRDRELSASPTTQLPGSGTIEIEIERRLGEPIDYAFCYLDLDNLKAFNDYYGYAKADAVIRQTGDLVRDVIAREGSAGDFIGHIAGDDFVFITTAAVVDTVCRAICDTFDRLMPLYYNKVDRERGHIETADRYGVLRRFPLMGVSLAAVTSHASAIRTYSDLASAAATGKKLAKSIPHSSYVRDGSIVIGSAPTPSSEAGAGTSDFEVA